MPALRDFVLFQIAWFAAVLGGAMGLGFAASCPAVALAGYHLVQNHKRIERELGLLAAIVLVGLLAENILIHFGAILYTGMKPGDVLPPVWIGALWLAFATLPNGALYWLRGRPLIQALLGALTAPPSYAGGAALGAAALGANHIQAWVLIGLIWAVACPAIFALASYLSPPEPTDA